MPNQSKCLSLETRSGTWSETRRTCNSQMSHPVTVLSHDYGLLVKDFIGYHRGKLIFKTLRTIFHSKFHYCYCHLWLRDWPLGPLGPLGPPPPQCTRASTRVNLALLISCCFFFLKQFSDTIKNSCVDDKVFGIWIGLTRPQG